MKKLPVTKKEYDESVIISEFIRQIREKAENNKALTDIHFQPKMTGYDIDFNLNSIPNNISIEKSRHLMFDSINVIHQKGGKVENKFRLKNADEFAAVMEEILK